MKKLCPIDRHGAALVAAGALDANALEALLGEADQVVADALSFADGSPRPHPDEVLANVW